MTHVKSGKTKQINANRFILFYGTRTLHDIGTLSIV